MKILVTGANGYIGSKLIKKLCDKGAEVIAADIDSSHIDQRATFICANIFEKKENWFEILGKPDICVHLAWRDGFIHNSDKHLGDLSYHFLFIKNLIDSGLSKIVSIGSMHEIGYWEGAVDEDTPCRPLSQYGVAKNALRQAVEIYAKQKNCLFQWLRCFYIYGDDKFGNSIFCKLRQAVDEGKTSFPFTSGKNKYDFIHIDELAEQLSICIMQNQILGIINCCSGIPVSLSEKVEWYIKENNLPISLEYGKYKDRPYDSPCIYGDNSKIKQIKELYFKKTILVTGVGGQLGFDVVNELHNRGFEVIGTDVLKEDSLFHKAQFDKYIQLDLTNEKDVSDYLLIINLYAIIHCAAWTNVDAAELAENKESVKRVNIDATQYLVEVARKQNAKFVYLSTDYVFDGSGDVPWKPDDKCFSPLNYYGKTKLEGEKIVSSSINNYFIVRISWAFGDGKNFIKTMYNIGKTHNVVNVVNDQIGTPTYTYDLARLLVDMVETNKYGFYHATNEGGYISWYDLTLEIYKQSNMPVNVIPVSTTEYGASIAKRPANSRLDKSKLVENGFKPLPTWKDALKRYLKLLLEEK